MSRDFSNNKEDNDLDYISSKKRFNSKLSLLTNQNSINKDLFKDPDSSPKLFATENYLKYIKEGLIHNLKANIINITNNTVYLDNRETIFADIIILATGYKLDLPFFEQDILKLLDYNENDCINPYLLYYRTINPMFNNLAFVGVFSGLTIQTRECQAKLAFEFILKKHKVNESDVKIYLNHIKEVRKTPQSEQAQIVVNNTMKFSDMLMGELGLLPDLDKIKDEDEELYEYLYYGPIIPAHYSLTKDKDDIEKINAVDYIKKLGRYLKFKQNNR